MQPVGVDWTGPEALPVIVRCFDGDAAAARALRAEGIPHELSLVEDAPYWAALTEIWRRGDGFVLLEHDNVPWPGALDDLVRCRRSTWCGYWYPLGGPGALGPGLGCVRFSRELVRSHPFLPELWHNVDYQLLDAAVAGAVAGVTGWSEFHLHWPAVAHARP